MSDVADLSILGAAQRELGIRGSKSFSYRFTGARIYPNIDNHRHDCLTIALRWTRRTAPLTRSVSYLIELSGLQLNTIAGFSDQSNCSQRN